MAIMWKLGSEAEAYCLITPNQEENYDGASNEISNFDRFPSTVKKCTMSMEIFSYTANYNNRNAADDVISGKNKLSLLFFSIRTRFKNIYVWQI